MNEIRVLIAILESVLGFLLVNDTTTTNNNDYNK